MNNETPLTRKDGVTPDRDLKNHSSPPRETQRLPNATPGWVQIPRWPASKESQR